MAFVGALPFNPARTQTPLFVGRNMEPHWVRYRDHRDLRPDPCTSWIVPRLGGGFTEVRQAMCDDRTWYASEHFNEILRPIRQDDYLISARALPAIGVFSAIGMAGRLGDRTFGGRQRQLLEVLHHELALLWQTPTLTPQPQWRRELSPRLTQVLDALLEGLSEKQVALRLGLRRPTVHNYITRLHELLGVSSRGELLAKARPRTEFRPRLLAAAGDTRSSLLVPADDTSVSADKRGSRRYVIARPPAGQMGGKGTSCIHLNALVGALWVWLSCSS